jgi:hypothetical protein
MTKGNAICPRPFHCRGIKSDNSDWFQFHQLSFICFGVCIPTEILSYMYTYNNVRVPSRFSFLGQCFLPVWKFIRIRCRSHKIQVRVGLMTVVLGFHPTGYIVCLLTIWVITMNKIYESEYGHIKCQSMNEIFSIYMNHLIISNVMMLQWFWLD